MALIAFLCWYAVKQSINQSAAPLTRSTAKHCKSVEDWEHHIMTIAAEKLEDGDVNDAVDTVQWQQAGCGQY